MSKINELELELEYIDKMKETNNTRRLQLAH